MEAITLVYSILGGTLFFCLGLVILIIAGKSIFFEFYRRLSPKGVDVWIATSSRQISQHYRVPKDNEIRIKNKLYITNPDKLLSLSEPMKEEAIKSMKAKTKRIDQRIAKFQNKIDELDLQASKLSNVPENAQSILQIKTIKESVRQKIEKLKKVLEDKEELYYHRRRGAYFYIEGDPIPKDFYEWYTEMDSITIDNIIARSMTKDPKAMRNLEKEIKMMKFLIFLSIIAGAVSAILAVTLKTDLQAIAQTVGATLAL